jgi:hypothetical protein
MRDAVVFLMGGGVCGIAGYMLRDFQIYLADEMKIRRALQDARDRIDREDAA